MPMVVLPRSLAALFTDVPRQVVLDGPATMTELIDALDARWPGMRDRVCEPGPRIREYINVFVDGDPADLAAPLGPHATVHILPAVAGG